MLESRQYKNDIFGKLQFKSKPMKNLLELDVVMVWMQKFLLENMN